MQTFTNIENAILRSNILTNAEHRIYLIMLSWGKNADKQTFFYSLKNFREDTGMAKETIIKAIKGLEELGLINILKSKDYINANTYTLNICLDAWNCKTREDFKETMQKYNKTKKEPLQSAQSKDSQVKQKNKKLTDTNITYNNTKKQVKNKFNDFEQRTYTQQEITELEQRLLNK